MAKKVLVQLDLNQLELLNLVLEKLASAPGSAIEGRVYYNTGTKRIQLNDGTTFKDLLYNGMSVSLLSAPTTSFDAGSQKIINLLDPTLAQDAATKAYVDALVSGLDWKNSVRCLAISNITLSGFQTIDGVTVTTGDRVAVVGQSSGPTNGLYVVGSGAWTRSPDADTSAEVTPNMCFFVEEGTVYADTQWRITTNAPIVLGTTALTFAQIGASTSYSAGTGIAIVGTVVSIDTNTVARYATATIGDGVSTQFTLTHNFNTAFPVSVTVFRNSSPNDEVITDVQRIDNNSARVIFSVAPTNNQYLVKVLG